MDILNQVKSFIHKNHLCDHNDRILIACSGGKDSMCLVDILLSLKYDIGLAYVDHNTRNGGSKEDGDFVMAYAKSKNIPFYKTDFDSTSVKASEFHTKAREFRYNYFVSVAKEYKYSKIATAHHKNDVVESLLINLSRKTGISGLEGIPISRENIIRPLHFLGVDEIKEYILSHNIEHIHDASNDSNDYTRNDLRNTVIPKIMDWNTNFVDNSYESTRYVQEAKEYINFTISEWKEKRINIENSIITLDISDCSDLPVIDFILYEILKPYGINKTQCEEILGESQSGKTWLSEKFIVLKDRKTLIIKKIVNNETADVYPFPFVDQIPELGTIHIEKTKTNQEYIINIPDQFLNNNLVIRHWKAGDYMVFDYGKKKLKKLFTDNKIDRFKKESLWILAYKNEVLWIPEIAFSKKTKSGSHGLLLK